MYASADEARDHFDSLISEKRQLVIECDVAISALESAYEYIEGVIGETETGDLLPTASSLEIDLFDRQMLMSDRIGEREDMRTRAEIAIDGLEWERDGVVQELEQREQDHEDALDAGADHEGEISEADQEAAAAYFDEVLGPVDNSGVEMISEEEYAQQEMWLRYTDNILGVRYVDGDSSRVDNSHIVLIDDDEVGY